MDVRSSLLQVKRISTRRFAIFRVAFGAYLTIHFAQLIPYAAELFSSKGVLPAATINFTYKLFPSPFWLNDSPEMAVVVVALCTVLSICFMIGLRRRVVAVLLWYGMTCLFNRNNLISNPALPYLGMMLLLCAAIPIGEDWSVTRAPRDRPWFFPAWVFRAAWILMAAGYTCSGVDKLIFSPSWTDGTALRHVL